MFNLDIVTTKNDNKDWPYRKLIIGPSGSGKTNYLLNSSQKDNNIIHKIYIYCKDLLEFKYDHLVKVKTEAGLKNLSDPFAFIQASDTMDDIYENIEDYNKERKRKVLIVFDDMISHVMSDKKAQQVLKELFIRCRKVNISLCFFDSVLFYCLKGCETKLHPLHYF